MLHWILARNARRRWKNIFKPDPLSGSFRGSISHVCHIANSGQSRARKPRYFKILQDAIMKALLHFSGELWVQGRQPASLKAAFVFIDRSRGSAESTLNCSVKFWVRSESKWAWRLRMFGLKDQCREACTSSREKNYIFYLLRKLRLSRRCLHGDGALDYIRSDNNDQLPLH